VVVHDTEANIEALTPAQISGLAADGVSVLVADHALVWTIAQADALIASGMAAGTFGPGAVPVIISDSAANIETLTVAQIGGLGLTGALEIHSTDASVSLTAAQATALEAAGRKVMVPAGDSVTLADTGAAIVALSFRQA
jgi:hypothetical protein